MKNRNLLLATLSLGSLFLPSCSKNTQDENVLRIGMECNYAPFNWTATEKSDYTLPVYNEAGKYADGYDIQLAKRFSKETGNTVQIYKLEWDSLIIQLNNNQIDAVIAGMTDTEERRKQISFSDEYYRSELVLITSKTIAEQYASKELGKEELTVLLKNQIIESQRGTVTDDVIETFKNDYSAIHATAVDTFSKAAMDVHKKVAFAMTAELPVAQSIVKNYDDLGIIHMNQDILGVDLSDLGVSIGIRKDDTSLKETLNTFLSSYTKEERNADMTSAIERSGE